jgi:TPR repeat protein
VALEISPDTEHLHERIYAETAFRATRQGNAKAALELALCHRFGVGTLINWSECLVWINKAAYLGSEVGLIWLKRLQPDIRYLSAVNFPSLSGRNSQDRRNVLELLIKSFYNRIEDFSGVFLTETTLILQLLKDTEQDAYSHLHTF